MGPFDAPLLMHRSRIVMRLTLSWPFPGTTYTLVFFGGVPRLKPGPGVNRRTAPKSCAAAPSWAGGKMVCTKQRTPPRPGPSPRGRAQARKLRRRPRLRKPFSRHGANCCVGEGRRQDRQTAGPPPSVAVPTDALPSHGHHTEVMGARRARARRRRWWGIQPYPMARRAHDFRRSHRTAAASTRSHAHREGTHNWDPHKRLDTTVPWSLRTLSPRGMRLEASACLHRPSRGLPLCRLCTVDWFPRGDRTKTHQSFARSVPLPAWR